MTAAAAMPPLALREAAPSRTDWRGVFTLALWFGVSCTAMESFALPLGHIDGLDMLRFIGTVFALWYAAGLLLTWLLVRLDRHLLLRDLAAAVAATALFKLASLSLVQGWWAGANWLLPHNLFHGLWSSLLYCGVFAAVYRLNWRAQRTRALLSEAEIARQRSEAALSTAQLAALRGQVEPGFLLRAMVEVEHRYADAPASAERLLDPFVAFLRAAMPGVRSGASTLAAELLLVEQHARIVAELEPCRRAWEVQRDGPIPELAFPPLLLLPVADQLAATTNEVSLALSCGDTGCTLTLSGHGPSAAADAGWLAPELLYRLQVGLRQQFGDAWTLTLHRAAAAPGLTLTLGRVATDASFHPPERTTS